MENILKYSKTDILHLFFCKKKVFLTTFVKIFFAKLSECMYTKISFLKEKIFLFKKMSVHENDNNSQTQRFFLFF